MSSGRVHGGNLVKISALLASMLLASSASAQEATEPPAGTMVTEEPIFHPWEAGLFVGAHFFNDDNSLGRSTLDDNENLSPKSFVNFGVRLAYLVSPRWGFEGEASFTPTKTHLPEVTENILFFRAHLIFNILTEGKVRPFLLVGYGDACEFSGDDTVIGSDCDGWFHAGLGFKIFMSDGWGIRLDGRIMGPGTFLHGIAKVGNETAGPGGPDYEANAGVFFAFGGHRNEIVVAPADRDGDGILDVDDACPDVKGVADPDPKKNGCPPPGDRDGDGITDDVDACPDVKGVKTDDPKTNGCPPDRDGDGILDADDACPDDKGPKTNDPKTNGCPDRDGDGIIDKLDKCPDQPETVNGYQDADGCPDSVPPAVQKFTGVIQGINFKFDSAQITANSHTILDKAVKVLKDYPDVKLEIQGHTDNKGTADYNKDLSQRRAEAVRQYLISKGIAESRLTSVGYGFDIPIADNKTDAGRAKNRRTEFKLIP